MKIRGLLILIVVAFAAYSGWWFIGKSAQIKGFNSWQASQQDAGWTVAAKDMSVTGFPNRFDTRLSGLEIAPEGAPWSWRAEQLHLYALSYKPNHIIAAWPGEQSFQFGDLTSVVRSDLARASVIVKPSTSLALNRFQFEGENIQISLSDAPSSVLGKVGLALFAQPDTDASYEAFIQLIEVTAPELLSPLVPAGDPRSELPVTLRLDAKVALAAPIDRYFAATEIETLDIISAEVKWGGQHVEASGNLASDATGYAAGSLELRFSDWKAFLDILQHLKAVSPSTHAILLNGFGRTDKTDTTADIRLDFRNGQTYLGPVPLGRAPKF